MTAAVRVSGLDVAYGTIPAVREVDFEVAEGDICVVLGANGAGKTSILRALFGLVKPRSGRIQLFGDDVTGLPPHKLNALGLAWVPEGRQVWATLSVRENLEMGGFARAQGRRRQARIDHMLTRFPILAERQRQAAGLLSGGEQQLLAIARALMCEPRVLLLDEPSLGLAPLAIKNVFNVVREINDAGITVLMVEQNARSALRLARWGYVMENGRLVASGLAGDLLESDLIKSAYLGAV
jgi:branched-chain amino acid transport system ATP-binding protein